ncbi:DUF2975 domain-containing protein [Actomonas aquatica]|uniref:DUF2975 domain-containing protein n=1 Tax=Actomonas aquatica TaxID=2866162 RepID=A0ABZ1CEI0_9BACT|nr:DUF2975 domain-containing protein [Opitutus sp. WL0086]WRQ89898.1 DUF2975 domain-containing protein [Opitutus sp. WL0086]
MNLPPAIRRLTRSLEWVLNITLFLCGIAGAAGLVFVGALLVVGEIPGGLTQSVVVETDLPAQTLLTADGEAVELVLSNVAGELEVPNSLQGLQLTTAVCSLITVVLIAGICWHARCLLRSLRQDHPFIRANARRLRWIAGLSFASLVWQGLSKLIIALGVSDAFPAFDVSASLDLINPTLLTVFALFIIAEVFAVGVHLKEEQDLTV